jgi:hypothetical protein
MGYGCGYPIEVIVDPSLLEEPCGRTDNPIPPRCTPKSSRSSGRSASRARPSGGYRSVVRRSAVPSARSGTGWDQVRTASSGRQAEARDSEVVLICHRAYLVVEHDRLRWSVRRPERRLGRPHDRPAHIPWRRKDRGPEARQEPTYPRSARDPADVRHTRRAPSTPATTTAIGDVQGPAVGGVARIGV